MVLEGLELAEVGGGNLEPGPLGQAVGDQEFVGAVDRAAARGEVNLARVTPRLLRLPVDLARHEMMITFQPVSEADIHEIVDDIVLPIWTRRD